ncbi:MAG TPA: C40 family peptidase, partial [Roseiflexaceae bacterium]|nr:C40 family peptidase [Roseiflexaceae bacterium]
FSGSTFTFGQRVEVAPLHVLVDASAGSPQADGSQLHYVMLGWRNPTGRPVPIDYTTQLTLRSITTPDGGQRADGWIVSDVALRQARQELLPEHIPPGDSTVRVPILAPPGQPKVVELRLLLGRAPGEPTLVPEATPTPNTDLRRPSTPLLVLQWTDSRLSYFGAPPCGDPGAVTEWGAGPKPAAPIAAPAGSSRLIEIALAQVGKPYIWGAKGPNAFDCSGLATWAYAQIGIRIPQGTAGQWPHMRPVGRDQLQPGDLAFMNTDEPPQADITHVGLLADVDGDGTWDLIHAASPRLGVRVDYDMFGSRYYAPRLRGFRTAR